MGRDGVRFYIDGTLVHTAHHAIGGTMRPIASDFDTGGGALSIDWMRMTPYASPGTFLSRIHDAGGPAADWGALSYVADVPSGDHARARRSGPATTPTPDGTWSSFAPIASGQDVATSGRYLQYRVTGHLDDRPRHPDAAVGDAAVHRNARHHGSDDHRPHAGAERHRRRRSARMSR